MTKQRRRSSIAAMAVNLPLTADGSATLLPLSDKGTKVYNYHYDQLNRLVAMDAFGGLNTATHTFSPVLLNDYQERVTYDPNGNILTYNRNGNQSANEAMDRLVYTYGTTNNQLNTLVDNASDGTYMTDIKAPAASPINYGYDQIGNITQDGSNAINWTVYGKIASQTGAGGTISYLYDAAANRISKTTSTGTTLYVRDAQGNVLATYQRGTSGSFSQLEVDLYGSSRLGMTRAPALPSQTINLSGGVTASVASFTRGLKSYELANHLGNVLLTITDKKNAVSSGGSLTISSYNADIATVQDYYPFGMQMPGRMFTASGAGNYRYGFNGKENDNEVKGVGDQIDYGMRIYDPRVARFMSVDPLTRKYAHYTPYSFSGNKPIWYIDLDGMEEALPWYLRKNKYGGKPVLTFGLGNLPTGDRWNYDGYPWYTDQSIVTFVHNSVAAGWNGIANTWNEALDGKSGTDIALDGLQSLRDIKGEDLTKVEFYENLGGFILTERLFSKVGDVKFRANLPPGTQLGGFSLSNFRSSAILFNIKRLSSFGVVNGLQSVQSFADVMEAGLAFVGKNARKIYAESGRFIGYESADGLKRFRPSAFKRNLGKFQANFEQRASQQVSWDNTSQQGLRSNMHVDTDKGFNYNAERKPPTSGTTNTQN